MVVNSGTTVPWIVCSSHGSYGVGLAGRWARCRMSPMFVIGNGRCLNSQVNQHPPTSERPNRVEGIGRRVGRRQTTKNQNRIPALGLSSRGSRFKHLIWGHICGIISAAHSWTKKHGFAFSWSMNFLLSPFHDTILIRSINWIQWHRLPAVATSPYASEELQRVLKTVNTLKRYDSRNIDLSLLVAFLYRKIKSLQRCSFVRGLSFLLPLIDSMSARFMYIFCPVSTFFPWYRILETHFDV